MSVTFDARDRNWAIYAHAAGLLIFTNIPLANAIAPLTIALRMRKEPAPFAQAHARASFNFQATFVIVQLTLLFAVLASPRFAFPVFSAYLVLLALNAALCIWGCARASDLKPFRYPLAIPFLRPL